MPLIALVRPPTAALESGERTYVPRQFIDFAKALEQHINYVIALREAGAQIVALPPLEHQPDAVFIEDTALVLDSLAVIAHSAVRSRWLEISSVTAALSHYSYLMTLPEGATFDGGDALVIGRTVYIGHSRRTNLAAINFLTTLLRQHGYNAEPVQVAGCLHLKTAVTHIGRNTVLLNPNWVSQEAFRKHEQIRVDAEEPMAANAMLIGSTVLMSASYPSTYQQLLARGFKARPMELSEFHKAEGGLTCLSILINTSNGS